MNWEHPWCLWGLAGLGVLWLALSRMRGMFSAPRGWLLLGLRSAVYAVIIVALAGPRWVQAHLAPSATLMAVDISDSMDAARLQWACRQLASWDSQLSATGQRTLIGFGSRAAVLRQWQGHQALRGSACERLLASARMQTGPRATNLEAGLIGALAVLPEGMAGELLLASDGQETSGHAVLAAQALRSRGVAVYPWLPPSAERAAGVAIAQLTVPDMARAGERFPVRLSLDNAGGRPVATRLKIFQDDRVIDERTITLPPGRHMVRVSASRATPGSSFVRASVSAEGRAGEQQALAAVEVIGPPQILYIAGNQQMPFVAQVLKGRQYVVDLKDLAGLPPSAEQLQSYDAVVLSGIPRTRIGREQAQALERYIKEGGGLLMIGAGGRLSEEVTAQAPIDSVLPVIFTAGGPMPQETKRRLSVILLVDRSASMAGSKMTHAKRTAVELVKQLDANDLLGVLAFDVGVNVVVPLGPVRNTTVDIIEKLVKVRPGGGTDFLPALRVAEEAFAQTGSTTQHMILISDGNADYHKDTYQRLFDRLRQRHITITTMALGEVFVNTDLMQLIAGSTGGRFYHLQDPSQLPQLVLEDTREALRRLPFAEEPLVPEIVREDEIIQGIPPSELPPLKGYLIVKPKPEAQVTLQTPDAAPQPSPILTHWSYGLGRVAVFSSDAEARWAASWIPWRRFGQFWSQLARWTMRRRSAEEFFLYLDAATEPPTVVVELAGAQRNDETWWLRLRPHQGTEAVTVGLSPSSAFRWKGPLPTLAPGFYRAELWRGQGEHAALVGTRWLTLGGLVTPAAGEVPGAPVNRTLLLDIAQATGGALEGLPKEQPQRITTAARVLDPWLMVVAICFFLADVAVRGRTML